MPTPTDNEQWKAAVMAKLLEIERLLKHILEQSGTPKLGH